MIYLNGQFMPLEQACVPVLDRGFIFGDGVYEVIPVYNRVPFRLMEHLARLANSMQEIRLDNPHSDAEWTRLVNEVISRNPWVNQSIYLQVTRGVAKRDHTFPKGVPPTVFVMSSEFTPPAPEQVEAGLTLVSASDNRWQRCHIKSTSLLGNVLLRQLAADAGAAEIVLLRDGFLTEGSASNILIVREGILIAPPKSHLILPGITYDLVLELAAGSDVPLEVREVSEYELRTAEELLVTSSSKELLAATRLDGKPVGTGKPGPVFRRLYQMFQEYKARVSGAPARAVAGAAST